MRQFPIIFSDANASLQYPLVSVIISNYNDGRYIQQAIESVFRQNYQNFEVIVVDDGSSDHSRQVMEEYGDRIIPVYQARRGQAEALNSGINRAKGSIICLLNADDTFHPEKLAQVVTAFQNQPHWVQVSHYWTVINQDGEPVHKCVSRSLSKGDVRPLLLEWGKYKFTPMSTLAFRREALQQVLPIPKRCHSGADAYLMVTVPFFGEIGYLSKSLMFYRIYEGRKLSRSADVSYLIHLHELNHFYIDQIARNLKIDNNFSLEKDADYRTFRSIQNFYRFSKKLSLWEGSYILILSYQESNALKRTLPETLIRLLWLSIYLLFPLEAPAIIRYGLRYYLLHRLCGKHVVA